MEQRALGGGGAAGPVALTALVIALVLALGAAIIARVEEVPTRSSSPVPTSTASGSTMAPALVATTATTSTVSPVTTERSTATATTFAPQPTTTEVPPIPPPPPPPVLPAIDPPPPAALGDGAIFVWPPALPPEGGLLQLAPYSRDGSGRTFGVGAGLDRWNGTTWIEQGYLSTCPSSWQCAGGLVDLSDPFLIAPSIGLIVGPRPGAPELVRLGTLATGWYRVRKIDVDGAEVEGRFQILPEAGLAPEVLDPDDGYLSTNPWFVEQGPVDVRLHAYPASGTDAAGTLEAAEAFEAALGDEVQLSGWTAAGWQPIRTLPVVDRPPDSWPSGPQEASLPRLVPGAYRLTRSTADGRSVHGHLVVVADAPWAP